MERSSIDARPDAGSQGALRALVLFLWDLVRLPIYALLIVLEPFVRIVLSLVAILVGIIACFMYFVAHDPHVPFWTMLVVLIGCGLLMVGYYSLVAFFASA